MTFDRLYLWSMRLTCITFALCGVGGLLSGRPRKGLATLLLAVVNALIYL